MITEIQTNGTGSGTTAQEFIELVNIQAETIDISVDNRISYRWYGF